MFTLLLENRLFLAPISSNFIGNVLDVGCGTGIWATDFVDAYPDAQVEAVDLSPIQPHESPPNCQFIIDDVEYIWIHPANHFGFVYIRCLTGAIGDWHALYRQAFHKIRPGGYIEHLEVSIDFTSHDGSVAEGHVMSEWSRTLIDCGEQRGRTFRVADKAKEWILEAGFEDVEQRCYDLPVGSWPEHEVCYCPKSYHRVFR